jgi:hypothetical protein
MAQVFAPRAGDGVDVMIGAGRTPILQATAEKGLDLDAEARRHGYELQTSLTAVSPDARRLSSPTCTPTTSRSACGGRSSSTG